MSDLFEFQSLHNEVEQWRSKFDDLLQSCDLYDTPFEQTQFENDVTALKDHLAACDKVYIYTCTMYMYVTHTMIVMLMDLLIEMSLH